MAAPYVPPVGNPLFDALGISAKQLLRYFGRNHRFEFLRSLHSPTGGVLLCNERTPNGLAIQRRLAIKHGLKTSIDADIQTEINILLRLIGAEHIIQLVPIVPVGAVLGRRALGRPFFIMEVTQGGPIGDWVGEDFDDYELWSIFICLIRGLIPMAYPIPPGPVQREFHPGVGNNPPPNGICHRDIHSHNILIDEFDATPEHEHTPRMKYIDFGLSTIEVNTLEAIADNLHQVGTIMMSLVTKYDYSLDVTFPGNFQDVVVRWGNAGATQSVETHAPKELVNHPNISLDMKEAIIRCLATDWQDRPSMYDILGLCQSWLFARRVTRRRTPALRFNAPDGT